MHSRGPALGILRQPFERLDIHRAAIAGERTPATKIGEQLPRHLWQDERIDERYHSAGDHYVGNDGRRRSVRQFARPLFTHAADEHAVLVGFAVHVFELDDDVERERGLATDRYHPGDRRAAHRAGLAAKPPLAAHVSQQQRFGFARVGAAEHRLPIAGRQARALTARDVSGERDRCVGAVPPQ